jgi:hypothetical protein
VQPRSRPVAARRWVGTGAGLELWIVWVWANKVKAPSEQDANNKEVARAQRDPGLMGGPAGEGEPGKGWGGVPEAGAHLVACRAGSVVCGWPRRATGAGLGLQAG